MEDFKSYPDVVSNHSARYKSALVLRDNVREVSLYSINNDFRYKFIDHITEANRPKVPYIIRSMLFWNQNYMCVVESLREGTSIENIQDCLSDIFTYDRPEFLEKMRVQTVRSWGFPWVHLR